jgi:hypothetical protein
VKVKLTKPVEIFNKPVREVELKEPTGGVYVKLGEPRILVFNASGSGYFIEQPDVIKAYLDRQIEHEAGGEFVMGMLCLEDAITLKEALFSFFSDATSRISARKVTSSSSDSKS